MASLRARIFSGKSASEAIAVFLHDDVQWHGALFRFRDGNYQCEETRQSAGSERKALPDELLAWLVQQGCRRLRVFLTSDVHMLDLKLPSDAKAEEVHAALAYELAPTLKLSPGDVRVAAVRANAYRMGGDPDHFLGAGFDGRIISRYSEACEAVGLVFEGIGSLEMAALAHHARDTSEHGLILVRSRAMFVAVPAQAGGDFYIRNVPVGVPREDDNQTLWGESLRQRLQRIRSFPITLLTTTSPPVGFDRLIADALDCTVAESQVLDEAAAKIMRHAAWANVGVVDNGCASVTRAKHEVDWRPLSALVAVMSLLLAILSGPVWLQSLDKEKGQLTDTIRLLQESRQKFSQAEARLAAERKLQSLLQDSRRVETLCLTVIGALSDAVGQRTRILRVEETDDRGLLLSGETANPEELPCFRRFLDRVVTPGGWRVEERGIDKGRLTGLWIFKYAVVRDVR